MSSWCGSQNKSLAHASLYCESFNILDTHTPKTKKTTSKASIHLGYWLLTYVFPKGVLNWQLSFGLWTYVTTGSWINELGDLASSIAYLQLTPFLWSHFPHPSNGGFLTDHVRFS